MTKPEPWYLHAILYAVIVILVILLVKVAIIDPKQIVQEEKYTKKESRLRMQNLREAENLWFKKHGSYTAHLDSLVNFVKHDPFVDSVKSAFDSLTRRPANPFIPLSHGEFNPDSLVKTPRSQQNYIVQIDTSTQVDTVVNRRGKVIRVDTATVIGLRYYIEDPDGYGSVGSLDSDAMKNSLSWE